MRKVVFGLSSLFFVLVLSTSSFAYSVSWDFSSVLAPAGYHDDGVTGLFNEVNFYSETTVTQFDTNGDFVVSVGDEFTDSGSLNATAFVPDFSAPGDSEGMNFLNQVTGIMNNMAGSVSGVTALTGGDTQVDYAYNTGSFELYTSTPKTFNFNTRGAFDDAGFNDGAHIATFELVSGVGHAFLDTNNDDLTNQGSGEFYLQATALATGFWFDADGQDIALIYDGINKPINWFVSTTDYNIDKPIFTPGLGGDFLFTMDVTHDGSIEFNVVPEPSTFLLLGGGLMGLGFYARRRKK